MSQFFKDTNQLLGINNTTSNYGNQTIDGSGRDDFSDPLGTRPFTSKGKNSLFEEPKHSIDESNQNSYQQSLNGFINSEKSDSFFGKRNTPPNSKSNGNSTLIPRTQSSLVVPASIQVKMLQQQKKELQQENYSERNKSTQQYQPRLYQDFQDLRKYSREGIGMSSSENNNEILDGHNSIDPEGSHWASGFQGVIMMSSDANLGCIIVLPYFFSQFGMLNGIFIILLFIFILNSSFYYLLKTKNLCLRSNYHTIAQFLSGITAVRFYFVIQLFSKLLNCMMLLFLSSIQLQQFIYNIQSFPEGPSQDTSVSFGESYTFCIIIMGGILVIAAFVVSTKQTTSLIRVFNMFYLSTIVVCAFIAYFNADSQGELKGDFFLLPSNFEFGYAVSSASLLFVLLDVHSNFFNVYRTLRKPSDKKMLRTSLYTNMLLGLSYILIGSLGYISSSDIPSSYNFLAIFSQQGLHVSLSSVPLIVYILYSMINFPIHFANARDFSFKLIGSLLNKSSTQDIPSDNMDKADFPVVFKSSGIENQVNSYGNNPFLNQRNNSSNPDNIYAQLNLQYQQQLQQQQTPQHSNNNIGPSNGLGVFSYDKNQSASEREALLKSQKDYAFSSSLGSTHKSPYYIVTFSFLVAIIGVTYFLDNILILILLCGVLISSVNSIIIPIAFYIKLSNYESTISVITSVLLLFSILAADITILIAEVFTLIE